MPTVPELLGVADGGNHGCGGDRTDARHFRDLLAQRGLLHGVIVLSVQIDTLRCESPMPPTTYGLGKMALRDFRKLLI
ncbi:hypothetical protein D9M72_298810 [compost metagenome]